MDLKQYRRKIYAGKVSPEDIHYIDMGLRRPRTPTILAKRDEIDEVQRVHGLPRRQAWDKVKLNKARSLIAVEEISEELRSVMYCILDVVEELVKEH